MAESSRTFTDPIHNMIRFDKNNPVEKLALDLIDTQNFQRLRRISQLGITSYIYPGATHTRFTHSLGTFAVAREMCDIIREQGFEDREKRDVALIAALLHDVGHGPYSHIFERILKNISGLDKKHELWSAEIITQSEDITPLLETYKPGFSKQVAGYLLMNKRERDLYPSIISGSFDADRMDYMMRDRFMCGIDGSVINKSRMMNSLKVFQNPEDGKNYFGIRIKARHAVEEYLSSRVDLYTQIYCHKYEQAYTLSLTNLFDNVLKKHELLDDKYSPLEKMLKGDISLGNYVKTTDGDIERFIWRMADSKDKQVARAAKNILNRRTYHCLELSSSISSPEKAEKSIALVEKIAKNYPGAVARDITIRAYDPHGPESPVYIVDHRERSDGNPLVFELSEVSENNIQNLSKRLFRVYIPNVRENDGAVNTIQRSLRSLHETRE